MERRRGTPFARKGLDAVGGLFVVDSCARKLLTTAPIRFDSRLTAWPPCVLALLPVGQGEGGEERSSKGDPVPTSRWRGMAARYSGARPDFTPG